MRHIAGKKNGKRRKVAPAVALHKSNEREDVTAYLKGRAVAVDAAVREYLTNTANSRHLQNLLGRSGYQYDQEAITKGIIDPALYLFSLGGKRWRPVLLLNVIDALGKDSSKFIEFSIIPEIIHNGTLIHDDIEDGSAMRRGAPAVHMKYGTDVALNLGDFMFYFPIVALLDSPKLTEHEKSRVLAIYQREMLKLSLGQATDIAWHRGLRDQSKVTEKQYLQMVYSKTGVLASMAAKIGAVLAGADDKTVEALGRFAASIGVAFQIEDDILNLKVCGVSKNKGAVGEDITEGKVTLLVIHALEKAKESDRERLLEILGMHTTDRRLIDNAISIINRYKSEEHAKEIEYKLIRDAWSSVDELLPDNDSKRMLKALAEYLINRTI